MMVKRLKRLPAGHKVYLPHPGVWRVTPQALDILREKHVIKEVPPLKLYPHDGLPKFPYDHEEGKIIFSVSTLGLGTGDKNSPWSERKPVGHMYWTVDVSDLVQHPERSRREEIGQEHMRRMVQAATTLRGHLQKEYFRHRILPQTEQHALEISQKALRSTCEHFHRAGLDVHPRPIPCLLAPPTVLSINAVINEGKREAIVIFDDGAFARVTQPLNPQACTLPAFRFTSWGQVESVSSKSLDPLDLERINAQLKKASNA